MRTCIGGCGARYGDRLNFILLCMKRVLPSLHTDLHKDIANRVNDTSDCDYHNVRSFFCTNCFGQITCECYCCVPTVVIFKQKRVVEIERHDIKTCLAMVCKNEQQAKEIQKLFDKLAIRIGRNFDNSDVLRELAVKFEQVGCDWSQVNFYCPKSAVIGHMFRLGSCSYMCQLYQTNKLNF